MAKKKSTSPTQRTLKWMRDLGYTVGVTEHWQSSFSHAAIVDAARSYVKNKTKKSLLDMRKGFSDMEKFGTGRRKDLFGFIDMVAIGNGEIIAIQCTAYSGLSARVNKIVTECRDEAVEWLKSGGKIEVHGWKEFDKPLNRKRWRPVIKDLSWTNGAINTVRRVESPADKSKPAPQVTPKEVRGLFDKAPF